MPNRWPINSGNWSNAAIWSGSIIPTASDDVFMNNQIITLDQNVTVTSIRNIATGSAIAGGRIEIYGNFNISASFIRSGATTSTSPLSAGPGLISFYGTGSSTITSLVNSGSGETGPTIFNGAAGILNIVGNIFNPNGVTQTTAVVNGSIGIINIIGNITGLINFASIAVVNNSGIINVTGNITAGSNNLGYPILLNQNTGIVNVTGNIIGQPFNVVGGVNNAVSHNSLASFNVTGNVQGARYEGIASTAANTISVIGQCIASLSASAVTSTSTTATNIFSGPLINSGSRNAIYCYNIQMYKNATTSYQIGVSGSSNTITLLSEDQALGMPATTNVRTGTIYGPTNTLTGIMAVPDPRSVSWGVAVDATSGSAIVKPEDIWNIALTSLSSSNSIGQRLANVSTSQSMASIVNAFNP
jgi:hypothetical protein